MTSPVLEIEQKRKTGDIAGALALIQLAGRKLGGLDPWLTHQYAMCLMSAKEWEQAYTALAVLSARRPNNAQVRYQIGLCLEAVGQYVEAKQSFQHAALLHAKDESQPDAARAQFALGSCLFRLGKDDEAVAAWERGLTLPVHSADGRFQRSLVLLAFGRYAEGWKEYEARKELHGYQIGLQARGAEGERLPAWDGQAKGRVKVYGTQGNGDVTQHSRYLPFVAERSGSEPYLVAGPELGPWLGYQGEGDCLWGVDIDSLPHVLGMPDPIPPMPRKLSGWVKRRRDKPTIGVCWKGNPNHANDRDRSSPISFLEAFPDPRWSVVSLQQGEGVHFANYAQTAVLMATLDAVVTVDTSVFHTAGTLGVPTIVIPQCSRDYRFGISGDTTPWYPSARIVRRRQHDDWPDAIRRAKLLLAEIL